jgi:single-stranded DNA-binding protein
MELKEGTGMDQVNVVVLTGFLERSPVVTETAVRFTIRVDETGKDGTTFKVFVPCEAYGRAESWEAGAFLAVEGRLKWRSYTDRDGEKKSGLCVFAREVRVLDAVTVADERG